MGRQVAIPILPLSIDSEVFSQETWEDIDKISNKEIYKGGDGSGHFGHRGRPGKVGGSLPGSYWETRYNVSGNTRVFRAARFERGGQGQDDIVQNRIWDNTIERTLEKGITQGKKWLGRPPSVYFTPRETDAIMFATFMHGFPEGSISIIAEIEIPDEFDDEIITDSKAMDDFGWESSFRIERTIPPEYIRGFSIFVKDYDRYDMKYVTYFNKQMAEGLKYGDVMNIVAKFLHKEHKDDEHYPTWIAEMVEQWGDAELIDDSWEQRAESRWWDKEKRKVYYVPFISIINDKAEEVEKGGPGSGHHGHRGRPGKVGGSLPDNYPQHLPPELQERIIKAAAEFGYPEDRIIFSEDTYEFEVGGEKFTAGMQYDASNKTLTVFNNEGMEDISDVALRRNIYHELMHHIYVSQGIEGEKQIVNMLMDPIFLGLPDDVNSWLEQQWGTIKKEYPQGYLIAKYNLALAPVLSREIAIFFTLTPDNPNLEYVKSYWQALIQEHLEATQLGLGTAINDLPGWTPAVSEFLSNMAEYHSMWGIDELLGDYPPTWGRFYKEILDLWEDFPEENKEISIIKGGPGSGHHGHSGRPGKVGGSLPDSTSSYIEPPTEPNPHRRGRIRTRVVIPGRDTTYKQVSREKAYKRAEEVTKEYSRLDSEEFYDPGGISRVKDAVREAMTEMKEEWLGYISTIYIPVSIETWNNERKARGLDPEAYGFYDSSSDKIYIRPDLEGDFAKSVVIHEIGHALHYASPRFGEWGNKYETDPDFDRLTIYSNKNHREGFAESFEDYVSNRGKYSGLDKAFGEGFAEDFGVKEVYEWVHKVLSKLDMLEE